jgi:outer membrane protein assembly factor BamB
MQTVRRLVSPALSRCSLVVLLLVSIAGSTSAVTISGKVFEDRNGNGNLDDSEPGIARVVVSDGKNLVQTSKTGDYELESEAGRIVFVTLPKGFRSEEKFYTRIDTQKTVHFPLVDWPQSRENAVRFVQVSDTHVTGAEDTIQTFIEDIEEINTLQPAAAFALATGDLVNVGSKTNEYEGYVKGIASFRIPFFSLPGNHDAKAEEGLQHYHRYLGPDYYSFNAGNCHFMLLNSMRFDEEVQQAWIKKDLAAAPKGSTLIFAFHYLPTEAQMRFLSDLGAAAVLSGHWHGNRVREHLGVLDLNTPPLRFGGLDRHPRSFRILEVKHGAVENELRLGGFKHHAVVVSPSGICKPENGTVPVIVNVYDSRSPAESVECEYNGKRIRLKQVSSWSWLGAIRPADASIGSQTIVAHVRSVGGEQWTEESTFQISTGQTQPAGALRLKWSTPTGGFMGYSSPQKGQKFIGVGVDDKGDLKKCGVVAFDLDGKKQWHFHTDSGIKNNIAAADGRFFAASVAGWLYALDEKTGKLIWKAELDRSRERWEVSAVTVADGVVYVGQHSYIAAFDSRTGKRAWEQRNGNNDWLPSTYSIPTVADDKLVVVSRQAACALNIKTGEVAWKLPTRFNGCTINNGIIYTIKNEVFTALALADGKTMWAMKDKIGDACSSAALADDKLVIGTEDGRVCAISPKDGSIIWSFQTGTTLTSLQPYKRGYSDVNSSPVIVDDKVFIGSTDGHLYTLSLATGEKISSHNMGVPIAATPLVHDDSLYLSGYDGNVYAFEIVR